jgi:hypothetical protein
MRFFSLLRLPPVLLMALLACGPAAPAATTTAPRVSVPAVASVAAAEQSDEAFPPNPRIDVARTRF